MYFRCMNGLGGMNVASRACRSLKAMANPPGQLASAPRAARPMPDWAKSLIYVSRVRIPVRIPYPVSRDTSRSSYPEDTYPPTMVNPESGSQLTPTGPTGVTGAKIRKTATFPALL